MSIPGQDAVLEFLDNEARFDKFINDPVGYVSKYGANVNSLFYYTTNILPNLNSTAPGMGAELIKTKQSLTGSVDRTQHDVNKDFVNLATFGGGAGIAAATNRAAFAQAMAALSSGGEIRLPRGTIDLGTGAIGVQISGTVGKVYSLIGEGGGITELTYTGSGDAIKIDNVAGAAILGRIKGITLNLTGAGSSANGIHNSGAWRCQFEDCYIKRTYIAGTGVGLLLDNTTSGTFDVKVLRPYITGFDIGIKAVGGNLSTTAITNFHCSGGYISGCRINVKISYALDTLFESSQSESALANGIELDNCNNFTWIGGAIEGNLAGYGISCGANVNGVTICAGMFNNASGDLNGSPLHYRRFGEQALDFIGELIRVQKTASSTSYLDFWKNGTADCKLGVASSGNSFSLFNGLNSDTEIMSWDATNGIFDLLNPSSSINAGIRIRNGGAIRWYNGGINYLQLYVSAMPTTGTWQQGTIAWNQAPTNAAGQPCGWIRVTTGSGNVLNTDWRVFGVTT